MPATFTGMVPASFETARKHPQSVRVRVSGGQDDEAVGRPHIPDPAFTQALIHSILRSQTFAKVVEGQSKGEDFILTVTLFSMDKRRFGHTVRLEAGGPCNAPTRERSRGRSRSRRNSTMPTCNWQPKGPRETILSGASQEFLGSISELRRDGKFAATAGH